MATQNNTIPAPTCNNSLAMRFNDYRQSAARLEQLADQVNTLVADIERDDSNTEEVQRLHFLRCEGQRYFHRVCDLSADLCAFARKGQFCSLEEALIALGAVTLAEEYLADYPAVRDFLLTGRTGEPQGVSQ